MVIGLSTETGDWRNEGCPGLFRVYLRVDPGCRCLAGGARIGFVDQLYVW